MLIFKNDEKMIVKQSEIVAGILYALFQKIF